MLKQTADYITYTLIGLSAGNRLAEALDFFIYDTLKIFLLLTTIIFVVAVIRSSFPPRKDQTQSSPINASTSVTCWLPCWES